MTQIMTPSEMTDGQIDKAVGVYRAMLVKHRAEFGSEAAQQVLGQADFVGEMLGVLRKRVELISSMIIRVVTVNRKQRPEEAISATGRNKYLNNSVVAAMPKGDGDSAEVYFFKLGCYISDADLEKEYELRGLKPADPYSIAAVNEADPAFADEHPNGTHWKDSGGRWCYAAFDRWDDERRVIVDRSDDDWGGVWWFAGLRK